MKFLNCILVLIVVIAAFSCKSPNSEYKLTKKQKIRIHQGHEYTKNKADRANDTEKEERQIKDKERLAHNRKVAASRNPKKKAAVKTKSAPFGF